MTDRHQTLEDLRQELRDLSQSLNKELLDLVNENYQDFLSLGVALQGGEEKIEEVRVGLLGFQRDLQAIRSQIEDRQTEMRGLLEEKKEYRRQINLGKALLEIADRIEELEDKLMIRDATTKPLAENGASQEDSDEAELDDLETESSGSDEDSGLDEDGGALLSLRRLERRTQKYVYIMNAIERIGSSHPFLQSQQPRLEKIKSTLLLDLNTALNQAKKAGSKGEKRTLRLLRLYDMLDAEASAVSMLKQLKI